MIFGSLCQPGVAPGFLKRITTAQEEGNAASAGEVRSEDARHKTYTSSLCLWFFN